MTIGAVSVVGQPDATGVPVRTGILILPLSIALALGACASVAPPAASPAKPAAASTPANQRAATPAALAVERQWLQSWFKDTPVLIAQPSESAVTIDVPRDFCFDVGQSAVKPALAAVLDKVSQSLRRAQWTRLSLLAAPGDGAGTEPLAAQRAAQMQRHLQSRGVASARLARPTATTGAAVQLRMEAAPAP